MALPNSTCKGLRFQEEIFLAMEIFTLALNIIPLLSFLPSKNKRI